MCLVDVYGDGDSKLIVADADKRLKMFKGSIYAPALMLVTKHKPLLLTAFAFIYCH